MLWPVGTVPAFWLESAGLLRCSFFIGARTCSTRIVAPSNPARWKRRQLRSPMGWNPFGAKLHWSAVPTRASQSLDCDRSLGVMVSSYCTWRIARWKDYWGGGWHQYVKRAIWRLFSWTLLQQITMPMPGWMLLKGMHVSAVHLMVLPVITSFQECSLHTFPSSASPTTVMTLWCCVPNAEP